MCTVVGKPRGKRQHGNLWCRWRDNIKTDLKEVGYMDVDWIQVVHDKIQWREMNPGVSLNALFAD
jgi:hypothetical protein